MWRPGDVVDGRFVLERIAGAGARGTVWRAVDVTRRDAVAVKLVARPDAGGDPRGVVGGEIAALASVRHDAVVGCRGWGRADRDTAYLALTWVDGESLAVGIARRPLRAADAVTLGMRIVDARAAIHGAGLIHGDLKPANVLCPRGDPGAAVVVDFGVARAGDAVATPATGTPAYMSPEQVRGDAALDGRADLFGLGCVLYEVLAGRPAFAGDSVTAVLTRVLFEPPPPLAPLRPDAPAPLVALIDELLAKDRALRPDDAVAVRARLDGLVVPADDAPVSIGGDEIRTASVVVARGGGLEPIAVRRLLSGVTNGAVTNGATHLSLART